mmetsp:Transcript_17465/g.46618  ORF Transcript_17465/g.46618 Transcript_17465/m.46618 type:complete len:255 (-) Transcript_17465:7-771(-)
MPAPLMLGQAGPLTDVLMRGVVLAVVDVVSLPPHVHLCGLRPERGGVLSADHLVQRRCGALEVPRDTTPHGVVEVPERHDLVQVGDPHGPAVELVLGRGRHEPHAAQEPGAGRGAHVLPPRLALLPYSRELTSPAALTGHPERERLAVGERNLSSAELRLHPHHHRHLPPEVLAARGALRQGAGRRPPPSEGRLRLVRGGPRRRAPLRLPQAILAGLRGRWGVHCGKRGPCCRAMGRPASPPALAGGGAGGAPP